ncbi:uncharacterized protein Z518_05904 [Rhinocladiella mackenziei CBS 650.93]|uniref:Rhinocladiella mackenziei CBS 650.93 unplaced genomic scaffold supercont1.4, whole genome shotgun sequence n=1 Tax=Rhinocladiella mackenziei CBS 650.93 TaxID=1442369 RepID=A0A0D2FSF1_9EURO|nr:uncharacterized protein Z518_05904 [Rhinocladiella mackenziei CBS 650.93]KIX05032.1 hypothetical protein Z518_05904 [Rhinocladiella mackenziei CBS 650.93]
MADTSSSPQAILHGYLDANHTSDLSAYWINRPTPWPFVLASAGLSIILGFLGVQASHKSWESKPKLLNRDSSNALSPPIHQTAYIPLRRPNSDVHHRRWSSASGNTYYNIIENDAMETYFADRRPSSIAIARTMHGGLGRFAPIATTIGISWSTVRAGAVLTILIKITMGEKHTYPGIVSIVIMFASVHTYLGSRAMPRILYLLIITDLAAIYGSIVLAILAFLQDKRTSYQQFGVAGGHCPCMLGFKTGHDMKSCKELPSPLGGVGCDSMYLWSSNTIPGTNQTMTYPKSCLLSVDHDTDLDPNLMTHMVLAEIIVGGLGLLYGLIVLCFAVRRIPRVIARPGQLLDAFSLNEGFTQSSSRRKMPGRAIGVTVLAFAALLMFAAVTIVMHVLDETKPIRLFYMDSAGPRVEGGNVSGSTSWSDCFVVDTPYSTDGEFQQWWQVRQSRVLRALALA